MHLARRDGSNLYKSIVASASKGKSGGSDGGMGSMGHEALELGSHAGLALATKNMPDGLLGIEQLKPDVAGVAAAALGMMFGKGKTRRASRAILKGGIHAVITRFVATETFSLNDVKASNAA